jgi:hypothetical protein
VLAFCLGLSHALLLLFQSHAQATAITHDEVCVLPASAAPESKL